MRDELVKFQPAVIATPCRLVVATDHEMNRREQLRRLIAKYQDDTTGAVVGEIVIGGKVRDSTAFGLAVDKQGRQIAGLDESSTW